MAQDISCPTSLAAGVAYEISNPITGISSLAQNLRYDTGDPDALETAQQIQRLTQRVSCIVGSRVGFAHGGRHVQDSQFSRVELNALAGEALHLIHLARSGQDVAYSNHYPGPCGGRERPAARPGVGQPDRQCARRQSTR